MGTFHLEMELVVKKRQGIELVNGEDEKAVRMIGVVCVCLDAD